MNKLYYGDCLTVMQEMKMGSVDLVYLDPPFNSNRDYNAIYKDETGRPLPDQIEAFGDLWQLDDERLRAIQMMPILMREAGLPDHAAELWKIWLRALREANPKLLAYLSYMTERLLPIRSLLKPTGSVYLHCDSTASHYIKVMMDSIFGHDNFRNEIIWRRYDRPKGSQHKPRRFGRSTDTILFYSRSGEYVFHADRVRLPLTAKEIEDRYPHTDDRGRFMSGPLLRSASMGERPNLVYEFQGYTPDSSGWRMEREKLQQIYDDGDFFITSNGTPRRKFRPSEDPGSTIDNIWDDISALGAHDKERLGYATQKPVALLERIILVSTNEGDVVLDPFCGCATTIEAAHKLGRRWLGIDIAIHAIKRVAKVRLEDRLGLREGEDFVIEGVPRTLEGALDLWERDKHHFQKWAIEQVDGFVTSRKTADGGIDGRLYFSVPDDKELKTMLLEVKGGRNVTKSIVRQLRGVMDREGAMMMGLIILHDLGEAKTRNFKAEMQDAGDADVMGVKYPRMQLLTVDQILAGQRFLTPSVARGKVQAQPRLPLG
ncbi:MAG: modification methylase EcaI [Bauldia sp.]|nr:modification methylase EcaI [Bauldia sp.]